MIWELVAGAAVAAIVSLLVCRALIAAGPVDTPDEEHKAHQWPTPTSGGLGIAVGYAVAVIGVIEFESGLGLLRQHATLIWLVSVFAFLFLILGFIDDTRRLGPRTKILAFSLLSIGIAITMGVVDELPLGGGAEWKLGLSFGLFGTALWVFTLVNSVNFLDGANGLSLGSTAIGILALGAIALSYDINIAAALCFCAAGAIGGFLVWNFPNGRIFAGDAGALFSGAMAAIASLIILARTDVSPFIPPILFMPLLADALLTLAWRLYKRRKILVGHQEHFYQIAIRAGFSPAHVTLAYWAAMASCGVLGILLAPLADSALPWIALVTLAALYVGVSAYTRDFAHKREMT
ncbi:MAG: undecaprenyl/decaprenyl-phosphate alpha-N-acetylglucosaminyl 1-phosphate transferase [Hyphomonadaceae bacterium]|nr:undecaprenyl/decaprenyl-phosphate alpha-N-acetylglucosaminyl 1-phosphate transferase [Hyphomonadaceae bacterium]